MDSETTAPGAIGPRNATVGPINYFNRDSLLKIKFSNENNVFFIKPEVLNWCSIFGERIVLFALTELLTIFLIRNIFSYINAGTIAFFRLKR